MKTSHIVSFIGSAQRPSKTRELARLLCDSVAARGDFTCHAYDLLDFQEILPAFRREEISAHGERLLQEIERADALIVGSPTHKGSYPGQFKHVFDLIDPARLAEKPVALVATGGGPRHSLMIEHQLRPLFGFFCAMTMPTAVYACQEDFDANGKLAASTVERLGRLANELHIAISSKAAAPSLARESADAAFA